MTQLVKTIRKKVAKECIVFESNKDDCSVPLKKDNCSVSLEGLPENCDCIIVDFDEKGSPLGKNQTRCEYLFVAKVPLEKGWVAVLEFKDTTRVDIAKVVSQLQAGARAAEKLIRKEKDIRFRPVLASRAIPKAARTDMRVHDIVCFHEQSESLRWIGCGDPLTKALD